MIALHARRSAAPIAAWAAAHPGRGLVVVLTGTDLYRDIRTDASARQSMQLADAMVVLQEEGLNLAHGVENDTHRDQHAGATEKGRHVLRHLHPVQHQAGHNRDDSQEDRAGQGQPGHDEVEELGRRADLPRHSLCRLTRRTYGMLPKQLLKKHRMQYCLTSQILRD